MKSFRKGKIVPVWTWGVKIGGESVGMETGNNGRQKFGTRKKMDSIKSYDGQLTNILRRTRRILFSKSDWKFVFLVKATQAHCLPIH
jgi:hypothetical protein